MAVTHFYAVGEHEFAVPAGVRSVKVYCHGAVGGEEYGGGGLDGQGGLGGRIVCDLAVTPGETLYVDSGGRGAHAVSGTSGAGGWRDGMSGHSLANISGGRGGGGGGSSAVYKGSRISANRVIVAGGGGGGSSSALASADGGPGGHALDTEAVASSPPSSTGSNGTGGPGGGWRGGVYGATTNLVADGGTNMYHTAYVTNVTSTSGYSSGDGYVTFEYEVQVTGSATSGLPGFSQAAAGSHGPIAPPMNLVATPVNSSTMDLTWTAVAGVGGYDIERNGTIIEENHPTNSYSDGGLSERTSYSYRVRAVE